MTDPFDLLKDELIAAAAQTAPTVQRRRPWTGRSRGAAVVLAALVLAGGVAAAATLFSGEPSRPLAGVLSGVRYDITLAPWIQTGEIGWCVQTTVLSRSARGGGSACSNAAPMARSPIVGPARIGGGLRAVGGPAAGDALSVVFTAPRVAAVRVPHGPTVLTRAFARVPYGYRAAVFAFNPSLPRELGAQIAFLRATQHVIALDQAGRTIPSNPSGPPTEPTVPWSPNDQPSIESCSLTARPGTHILLGQGTVVRAVTAAPAIIGQAFLPCLSTDLALTATAPQTVGAVNRGIMQAAILLNAKNPAAAPAPLPNVAALPGHPGVFNNPTLQTTEAAGYGLTATRAGHAWLVVTGGNSTASRLAALSGLRVAVIDPRPPRAPAPGTPGALCTIAYHPTVNIQETTSVALTTLTARPPAAYPPRTTVTADLAGLKAAETARPHDPERIARAQARLALDEQAEFVNGPQSPPLRPNCATATFYDQNQWPMTATIRLSTGHCSTPLPLLSCSTGTARQRSLRSIFASPEVASVANRPDELTATLPAGGTATIRRYPRWWLIVTGGPPDQQQRLLVRLAAAVAPRVVSTLHPPRTTAYAHR
jgi:hypothetical protein